jgi:hypothetical protein
MKNYINIRVDTSSEYVCWPDPTDGWDGGDSLQTIERVTATLEEWTGSGQPSNLGPLVPKGTPIYVLIERYSDEDTFGTYQGRYSIKEWCLTYDEAWVARSQYQVTESFGWHECWEVYPVVVT